MEAYYKWARAIGLHREVSGQEAVYRILSMPLKQMSTEEGSAHQHSCQGRQGIPFKAHQPDSRHG